LVGETNGALFSPRRFTATMQMNTKTKTESALVIVDIDGRWAGACKK